jgi:hypothetical protein
MAKIHVYELVASFQDSNILWIIIPIFFVGVITDKYQEEFGTSIGNAISNGALITFTGFSWLQLITSRGHSFPIDITISQLLFSAFIILYGFAIVASGFKTGEFAKKYGRIRVITFMLIFFTIMIYIPIMYNFVSIVLFVLLFPFYYAFITELIKVMPSAGGSKNASFETIKNVTPYEKIKYKLQSYLR